MTCSPSCNGLSPVLHDSSQCLQYCHAMSINSREARYSCLYGNNSSLSKTGHPKATHQGTSRPIVIQSQYSRPVHVQGYIDPYATIKEIYPVPKKRPTRIPLVNKLPPEVLESVFLYSMEDWNGKTVESIMAVCSSWLHVCLATPSLWTTTRLNISTWKTRGLYEKRCNYIFHHLDRSGVLPMQVFINASPSTCIQDNSLREYVQFAQGALQLLFTGGPTKKGADTWEALTFEYEERTPRRLLDFLGMPMPSLREMNIKSINGSSLPIMELPALRSLKQVGVASLNGAPLSSLQSLVLENIRFGAKEAALLSQCTALRFLSLHYVMGPVKQPMKSTLPELTHLSIRARQSTSFKFLRLPKLHTVAALVDPKSLYTTARLPSLAHVQRLELVDIGRLPTTPSLTPWGFSAWTTRSDEEALPIKISEDAIIHVLRKCKRLVEVEGSSEISEVLLALLKLNPNLCSRLQRVQSRDRSFVRSRKICR